MALEIPLLGVIFLVLIFIALIVTEYYARRPAASKQSVQEERRGCPRHKISLRIKYRTPIEEGVTWIRDISETGARLFLNNTLKTLEVGETLAIEIHLPYEGDPISIQGNIVWSEGDDAGFKFDKIVQGDITSMVKYVSERVGREPEEAQAVA